MAVLEVKNGRDARVYAALFDVPVRQLAEKMGASPRHVSNVLHERMPLSRGMRARFEQVFEKVAAGEIAPEPVRRKSGA